MSLFIYKISESISSTPTRYYRTIISNWLFPNICSSVKNVKLYIYIITYFYRFVHKFRQYFSYSFSRLHIPRNLQTFTATILKKQKELGRITFRNMLY